MSSKNKVEKKIPISLKVIVTISILWIVHTMTGITVIGVENLRFTKHKMELGFVLWEGWKTLLIIHAFSAVIAIGSGILAFVSQYRRKWTFHRRIGSIYVISVIISSTASLPIAITATGDRPATTGFLLLAFLWLLTTFFAYRSAKTRKIMKHKKWITRSYAFTMANQTLHVILMPLTALTGDRLTAYKTSVWLCMVINYCVAEVFIRRASAKSNTKRQIASIGSSLY